MADHRVSMMYYVLVKIFNILIYLKSSIVEDRDYSL